MRQTDRREYALIHPSRDVGGASVLCSCLVDAMLQISTVMTALIGVNAFSKVPTLLLVLQVGTALHGSVIDGKHGF